MVEATPRNSVLDVGEGGPDAATNRTCAAMDGVILP
jgi:hypothetical protein